MAMLEIGSHCEWKECASLDFLPIVCKFCERTFWQALFFVFPGNRNLAHCISHLSTNSSRHAPQGQHHCTGATAPSDPTDRAAASAAPELQCSVSDCRVHGAQVIVCDKCAAAVCLVHRHYDQHTCHTAPETLQEKSRRELTAMVAQAKQQAQARPKPRKQLTAKARVTLAKVNLMKLKLKAVGNSSIPTSKRVFFQVFCEKSDGSFVHHNLFFSSEHTVGRVIDDATRRLDLPNPNATPGIPHLRLLSVPDGAELDPALRLDQCAELVPSGAPVLLTLREAEDVDCSPLQHVPP
eukprot:m.172499 g.172499  ORF g.172499 m.172499 type:complete len:295 (+) comp21281_c0_seq1:38-922(+)